jgi:GNAT superfamily N-acetyltransferase
MPGGPPTGPAAAHLYLECDRLDEVCAGLAAAGLAFEQPPTDMPYLWREAHLRDPDGHQVRLYRAGSNRLNPPWRLSRAEQEQLVERLLEAPPLASRSVRIEPWTGSRRDLLPLFELADDSVVQIERYIDEGHVITAIADGPVGHLQLVHGGGTGHLEIRSLAVAELWQRKGIGRRLVAAAIEECRARGVARLTVSTAASSLSALRFYLAQGFRVSRVLRDAFGEAQGYPPGLRVEGLPLNDALLLDLEIGVARASMGDA